MLLKDRWRDVVLNFHVSKENITDDAKDSFCEELELVFDKFPKYNMKIFLGDFNARMGGADIVEPTITSEILHEISCENGVRAIEFVTSKNLTVKIVRSPHSNTHKCSWTSPDGYTHNQIEHTLINSLLHSSVLDIPSFMAADCGTDHYLVVVKLGRG
jgi:hypothetical protein